MSPPFRIEPLGNQHDRQQLTRGVEALYWYFRQQVRQDVRRLMRHCFVAVDTEGDVGGYYTFAAASE